MSHPQQINYIKKIAAKFPNFFIDKKILEVGSLDINGSVRTFFTNCNYLGIDLGTGKGVDLVCSGHELDHPDQTYDCSITTECFEHNPFWVETFRNMIRMTKSGGLIVMTCATEGRPEHGTARTTPQDAPLVKWDYYKNLTENDFREEFDFDKLFSDYDFEVETVNKDLYFYGIKK